MTNSKYTLVWSLEYGCYPVWIIADNGETEANDVPLAWENRELIDAILSDIQKKYDALFVNTPQEFRYIGFQSAEEKRLFILKLNTAMALVERTNAGQYPIENRIGEL